MDPLNAAAIRVPGVETRVVDRCASTNALLLAEAPRHPVLLAAEEQATGRGRRGRRWHSDPGAGVTFSIARTMARSPGELSGLSLAVGVAAARSLRALGVTRAELKWPNDLLVGGAKLGGILIETRQRDGRTAVVVGIGINCRPVPRLARRLRRRVAALDEHLPAPVSRNAVIGTVAREVLAALEAFERSGLAAFAADWAALHAHEGKRLRVRLENGRTMSGVAEGIGKDGALKLRTRTGLHSLRSARIIS